MRRELPALLLACAVSAALLSTRAASAQAPTLASPNDEGATRLFREGRALLNKGRFPEACEKFQASLALRRSPGTLLNVGNCSQARGDLVGARRAFEETAALASQEPDQAKAEVWSAAAREELAGLASRIPSVVVGAPPEAGVEVRLDGEAFAAFGAPHALNPGPHRLVASAPGKQDHQRDITLSEGEALAVHIPRLEPTPRAAAPASGVAARAHGGAAAVPTEAEGARPSRVVPWALVGVGGAVLAGGIVTGLVAAKQASDLESACPNHVCEGDLSEPDAAFDTALVADILMGAGLVATAAGVTWLVLSAEDDASAASISAACDLDGCGASVRGRF